MLRKVTQGEWTLVHERTGKPVYEGETVLDFRGDADTINGGRPPHKPSSSGFVWTDSMRRGGEFYASVFDLKWVREKNETVSQ